MSAGAAPRGEDGAGAAPRVTAIVTSYNHEHTLRGAVESALAQEVEGLEVLVVDDASTDASPRILDALASRPGLRILRHERNLGISPVFNRGLQSARGRFVAYLGSDDYWLPGHLAGAVAELEKSDVDLCYGRVRVVDGEDRDISEREALFDSAPDADFFPELLRRSNFVPLISVVMRREAALSAGGFDEGLDTLQDYDLWLRMGERGTVRFLDRTSAAFRWDGANASRRSAENSVRLRRELVKILERWLDERPEALRRVGAEADVTRRLARVHARLARRLADPAEAARHYRRSLALAPVQPGVLASFLGARLRAVARRPSGSLGSGS